MAEILDGLQNRVAYLCAKGWLQEVVDLANALDNNYCAITNKNDVLVPWLKVQSLSVLGLVFPDNVYISLVSKLDDYGYGTVVVSEANEIPQNPLFESSDKIRCDIHPTKTPILLKQTGAQYIDTEKTPTQVSGLWEVFSGCTTGKYVLTYGADQLFTEEITVP